MHPRATAAAVGGPVDKSPQSKDFTRTLTKPLGMSSLRAYVFLEMKRLRILGARAVAFGLVAALALPVAGNAAPDKPRVELKREDNVLRPLGSFTPSFIDGLGASQRAGSAVDARAFRFTPSGQPTDKRAITLGIRTRTIAAPDATRGTDESAGYDVGMALGTRGLALTGQVSKLDSGLTRREAVTVGLGYGRRHWTTALKFGAEDRSPRGAEPLLDRRYTVELGGAYSLRRNLSVGAGVRYRVAPEDAATRRQREQDGAAFVGAAVAF